MEFQHVLFFQVCNIASQKNIILRLIEQNARKIQSFMPKRVYNTKVFSIFDNSLTLCLSNVFPSLVRRCSIYVLKCNFLMFILNINVERPDEC